MTAHFVKDYRALVGGLLERGTEENAMSVGVGGNWEGMAATLGVCVRQMGLPRDGAVVDVGCGSGRLAKGLQGWFEGNYFGQDVVPEFVDYAKRQVSGFVGACVVVEGLEIERASGRSDMVCFFSVLTHLKPEEGYAYLREARRVLKPGGVCLVSVLEYAAHWDIFESMVAHVASGLDQVHLNTFLGKEGIQMFAGKLGFEIARYYPPDEQFLEMPDGMVGLGQGLCVLAKPR